jgi:hypothetical protein
MIWFFFNSCSSPRQAFDELSAMLRDVADCAVSVHLRAPIARNFASGLLCFFRRRYLYHATRNARSRALSNAPPVHLCKAQSQPPQCLVRLIMLPGFPPRVGLALLPQHNENIDCANAGSPCLLLGYLFVFNSLVLVLLSTRERLRAPGLSTISSLS